MERQYWATLPVDQAAKEIYRRIDSYFQWLRLTGTYKLWLKCLREFYAGFSTGGELAEDGDQGEVLRSKENHFHNVGLNIIVATTGSRPNFEPKAANSDHSSMSQVIIAKGLLDVAMRDKDLEGVGVQVVTIAGILAGEAYSTCTWDPKSGRQFARDPDTQQVETTGDIRLRAYMPIDVARDHTKITSSGHCWYAVRDWINRYELAASRPEMTDRIVGLPGRWDEAVKRPTFTRDWRGSILMDSDDAAVWTFYHDKTPALPDGRMTSLAADDVILFDGPMPYDSLATCVQRMAPEEMHGTQLGYSTSYDLLVPQHEINSADSTITTSIANVGTGVIWAQPGGNVTVESLEGGPKLIRSETKPEPVTLLDIAALETIDKYKQAKVEAVEAISGVNSARRGTLVNEKQMSGAALALLDAKSIEFNKGLERGYIKWLESTATAIIRQYQQYAQLPQVAEVAGKANRSFMREFTGADLNRITRVTVDLANPMARTTSGRMTIAQELMRMGVVKTPEEFTQVLTTGNLDPVIEGSTAELMNVRAENERLGEGQPVTALAIDNHLLHIKEHSVVVASPESREDPNVVTSAMQHIQEHIGLWQTTDPTLLAALGIPPPPMPPPLPGPPPSGGPPLPPGARPGPGNGHPPSQHAPSPEGMPPAEALMM